MSVTGKTAEVMFEKALETHQKQMQMVEMCTFDTPDPAKMQNSNNVVWTPVQQYRPVIDGFDLTGSETDIIEETYPQILGTPKNDFVVQRADQMRDKRFWERAGEESGRTLVSDLNKRIAATVAIQGSKAYRSTATSGYDFIAEGQAILNETQQHVTERCFVLNDRANLKFSKDLAARQTLQGQPADTWKTGQIGQNIAEFDLYTGSYLPTQVGGADPATTVTATVSEAPEGGTVDTVGGIVTNVDYRVATIAVTATASYNVGDKVTFEAVQSLGLQDKEPTGQLMTFTIVAIPNGTSVTVYPKPIAKDDAGLSPLEKAYANIDTQILSTDTMNRVNIDATSKVNLFWDKSAVEVIGGTIPAELFAEFDGMKVLHDTMPNGQVMYMVYDGNIATLNFRFRIFTWDGITVCNPSNAGVAFSA